MAVILQAELVDRDASMKPLHRPTGMQSGAPACTLWPVPPKDGHRRAALPERVRVLVVDHGAELD